MNVLRQYDTNPEGSPVTSESELLNALNDLEDPEHLSQIKAADERLDVLKRDPWAVVRLVNESESSLVRYASTSSEPSSFGELFAIDDDTEVPLQVCIPVDLLTQVVLDYFRTGQLSERVRWRTLR